MSDPLPKAEDNVAEGDVVICWIDEWNAGKKEAFDGTVTAVRPDGVEVCYLSGYRSRDDFVPWADVVAKVDERLSKRSTVADGSFSGLFVVFKPDEPKPDRPEACAQANSDRFPLSDDDHEVPDFGTFPTASSLSRTLFMSTPTSVSNPTSGLKPKQPDELKTLYHGEED